MTSAREFATHVRHLRVRTLMMNGAVTGLFFSQAMSWQHFVDASVARLIGGDSNDPLVALLQAVSTTLLTVGVAWVALSCSCAVEATTTSDAT